MIYINRFFTEENIENGKVILTDDNVHHIKNVLKIRENEKVILVKNKKELLCTIDKIEKNSIILYVEEELCENKENEFSLTLIQGVPKGDKSDFICEKATEAGASGIVFVNMKRSVAKFTDDKALKKLERFSKIAEGAACQSGRLVVPKVEIKNKLSDIDFSSFSLKLLCYEDEKNTSLKEVLKNNCDNSSVAVVIGPEGGIDKEEADYLIDCGFKCVSLGKRILRCETAGLHALANINYELNN